MKLILITIVNIFCFSSVIFAQEENVVFSLKPKDEVKKPSCELNSMFLTILSQQTDSNDLLIIVSHLGKTERAIYGQRRLANAKTFFVSTDLSKLFRRSTNSIILAVGERVEGNGFVDFYVKGELMVRLNTPKNKDLFLIDCVLTGEFEKPCSSKLSRSFYPCKSKKRK